jgi:magnesium chelatase family protein
MLARVQSYLLQGIDALPCEVEVDTDLANNETKQFIVGLADTSVKESLERVKSALSNSGYFFPSGRTVINLAPADVRKESPLYDLPIAVGMLIAQGIVSADAAPRPASRTAHAPAGEKSRLAIETRNASRAPTGLDPRRYVFAGELALDGRLRPVKGVIAMAALAASRSAAGVIVPADNAKEAAVVPGVEVLGVRTITEVVGLLRGDLEPTPEPPLDVAGLLQSAQAPIDFSEVRGQEAVKRAIVVAAAGGHNILQLYPGASGGAGEPGRPVGHKAFQLRPGAGDGGGDRRRSDGHRARGKRVPRDLGHGASKRAGRPLDSLTAFPGGLGGQLW